MPRATLCLLWILCLLTLAAIGCGSQADPGPECEPGAMMCIAPYNEAVVCAEDGSGWTQQTCPDGTVCFEDACQELACRPDSTRCQGGGIETCEPDGSAWSGQVPCEAGQVCQEGACVAPECAALELRCADETTVERCHTTGMGWEAYLECPPGTGCFDAMCLPWPCEEGQTECGPTTLYTCGPDGNWGAEACADGRPCVFGTCVECLGEGLCAEGQVCEEGVCVPTSPTIITDILPPATVATAYEAWITAEAGLEPYVFSVVADSLPEGLTLEPAGRIAGAPTEAGTATFTVQVVDQNDEADEGELELQVYPEGPIQITTTHLPAASHGFDYSFSLAATGGVTPYGWQLLDGHLPTGMFLLSNGTLRGIPDEIGTFPLSFRVFDGASPADSDTGDLELVVEVSPLEIVGDTEYDLLLLKIIVLPVLVPVIPYSTNLQARGGLRPYEWSERDAPPGLGWVIPSWGLPDGLSLDGSGRLSGWVVDVSDAQRISIPFGPELAGYFIYGRVQDSQDPADFDEAIFCVPTIPL